MKIVTPTIDDPAEPGHAPSGTDTPAEAGTSTAKRGDRSMKYVARAGTQKTHPNKPSQSNVMHHLG
jgi:hypothetical protein